MGGRSAERRRTGDWTTAKKEVVDSVLSVCACCVLFLLASHSCYITGCLFGDLLAAAVVPMRVASSHGWMDGWMHG